MDDTREEENLNPGGRRRVFMRAEVAMTTVEEAALAAKLPQPTTTIDASSRRPPHTRALTLLACASSVRAQLLLHSHRKQLASPSQSARFAILPCPPCSALVMHPHLPARPTTSSPVAGAVKGGSLGRARLSLCLWALSIHSLTPSRVRLRVPARS